MLFDTHIHFFPDKLKGKVFSKLTEIAGAKYYRSETLEDATEHNNKMGITCALALHIATNPNQQTAVNNFAYECQSDSIINFGSVHPRSENAVEELKRIREMGLKGIKLHPDYQDFMADSKELYPIYKTCEDLGLIIAFHVGKDPYSPELIHCPPKAIKNISSSFSTLTIIAAHMGGMDMSEECLKDLVGSKNVYFDTAFASEFINPQMFSQIVNTHGVDKILFATDSPWSTAEKEIELIDKCNFTSAQRDKIFYNNACYLLTN